MVDLFTNVKGSGFATPIPGGAGGGTPATAKVFNGDGYNAYDPTYIVSAPYNPSGAWRFLDVSDVTNITQVVQLFYNSGYPTSATPPSQVGNKPVVSKNGYIYTLGSSGNSIHVMDATDVASMSLSSFIAELTNSEILGCFALQAHPTKDLLWCMSATSNRVFTVDITNPASPVVIGGAALDPVDLSSYVRDFCISYDGEYAFIRMHDSTTAYNKKYVRIELDALNAPTNVTEISSGFTIPSKSDAGGFVNYIEDPSGIPYIVTSNGNNNAIEIATLDTSYNMTSFVQLQDANLYDNPGMVKPLPYGYQFYPTSKLSYLVWEDDDDTMGFEVWDGTNATRLMDVPSSSDFNVNPIETVDSWDNYIAVSSFQSSSSVIRIFQWNTVNSLDFVDHLTVSWNAGMTLHVE